MCKLTKPSPKLLEKYSSLNPNDVVFTPREVAKQTVEMFSPSGRILEPCKGEGVFLEFLPTAEWCEILEGKNFFDYIDKVDWVVTNPPYSNFNEFLAHSFEIADNVVFIVPFSKVFKSVGTLRKIERYGGIVRIHMIPAGQCGFPFGYPAGIFHFKKDYKGDTKITYEPEKQTVKEIRSLESFSHA